MNNAGDPDDSADLLRLRAGLEGLREIRHDDSKDDFRPGLAGHVSHLRKMLASLVAQLFSRDALVER